MRFLMPLLGVLLGLGLGWLLWGGRPAPTGVGAALDRAPQATPAVPDAVLLGSGPAEGEAADVDVAPVAAADERVELSYAAFADLYRKAYATQAAGAEPSEAQVLAAWKDHQAGAANAGVGYGANAGRAEARRRVEALIDARDDMITLMKDPDRRADVRAAAHDVNALETLLAHRGQGPTLDGPKALAARREAPLPDGAVLDFGPGVHRATLDGFDERVPFPPDVTIRGAGMDRTLIVLSDASVRSVLFNLHIRDCTIDCGNDGAFDHRSHDAAIRCEDVRFVRFDAGHGGCTVFDISGEGAVYCVRCEFVCGYGTSPGMGNVLRRLVVARFDDCLFDRFVYAPTQGGGVFARCRFRDCRGLDEVVERALARPDASGAFLLEAPLVEWTLSAEARESWTPDARRLDWEAFRRRFE